MLSGLLAASLMLPGCLLLVLGAGAGAGVGTVAYVRGELQTTKKDELGGTIEGKRGDGKASVAARG